MPISSESDVLTTGQVARICRVAPRTVSKWFDRGHLPGYKIPGSRDRRIPVRQLVRFMKEHGIPTDALETGTGLTLVVAAADRAEPILDALDGRTHTIRAETLFEAGCQVERQRPQTIVIDARAITENPVAFIRAIRTNAESTRIVLIGEPRTAMPPELNDLVDAYVAGVDDARALADAVAAAAVPASSASD